MSNKKSDKQEILQAISGLSAAVFSLTEKVDILSLRVDALEQQYQDILLTTNHFADQMEQRFLAIEQRLDRVEQRLDKVEQRLDGVEQRLVSVEQRLTRLEMGAVTKEYLDEKLYSLKGDMIVMFRQENTKLETLVEALQEQRSLSLDKGKKILALEPFPKI